MLHTLWLRAAGLLRRALAAESAAGNQTAAIRASASQLEAQFTQWLVSLDNTLHPRPIPIQRLVHVQASAALTAADHLRGAPS